MTQEEQERTLAEFYAHERKLCVLVLELAERERFVQSDDTIRLAERYYEFLIKKLK